LTTEIRRNTYCALFPNMEQYALLCSAYKQVTRNFTRQNQKVIGNELQKFMIVAKELNFKNCQMPKCIVDDYWHNLIKEPNKYLLFTATSTGLYVEHKESNGFGEISWVKKYEELFGKLDKVWFTSSTGKFDEVSFKSYYENGKMIASWDCTPAIGGVIKKINDDLENLKKIEEVNEIIRKINENPENENVDEINTQIIIDSIKNKIDRFNIDEIKKRNNIK